MVKLLYHLLIVCLLTLSSQTAFAHSDSRSIITLDYTNGDYVDVSVELDIFDLAQTLPLDANNDKQVTYQELLQNQDRVLSYIGQSFSILQHGISCKMSPLNGIQGISKRLGKIYAVTKFRSTCTPISQSLGINFTLFSNITYNHRGILNIKSEQGETLRVLEQGSNTIPLVINAKSSFFDFGVEGVTHIFSGYDHMAFLLLLLLPLSLLFSTREQFLKAAAIVTAFTLAHTITLTLASTGHINLPSYMVEAAIAASVVLAALHNIFIKNAGSNWKLAFTFGLIHGFGFASALGELTSSQGVQILSLIGFNLGVEIGQLMIVIMILPLFVWLAKQKFIGRYFVPVTSSGIGLLGVFWLLERLS